MHKTLSPKTLSSKRVGFTSFDSPLPGVPGWADQRQRAPRILTGAPWGEELLGVTGVTGVTLFCRTLAGCDT